MLSISVPSCLRMFKVSHQIINEKTVQVYSTLHGNLVMIAFEHTAQQCLENDLVTAESQLVELLSLMEYFYTFLNCIKHQLLVELYDQRISMKCYY